eukprot:jgi/Picsp_1/3998/NSC_01510-R1_---NA---
MKCNSKSQAPAKWRKKQWMERREGEPEFYSDEYWNRATVKCYFDSFCKHKEFSKEIRETVKLISLVSIHAHNVMSIYLSEGRGRFIRHEERHQRVSEKKEKDKQVK